MVRQQENYFFIVGENSTLNEITEKIESFYGTHAYRFLSRVA